MICKKCGQSFEDSFNNCPNCGENANGKKKEKKPILKKWWFWLIIAIVLIVTIGSSGSSENQESPATSEKTEQTTKNTDTYDEKLTTENTVNKKDNENTTVVEKETTEGKDNFIRVGEKIDANGLEITFVSGEEYTDYNQYLPPKDGNIIVKASFNAVNNSNTDKFFSIYDFNCYADGVAAEEYFATDDALSATLSTGRSGSCNVYFEVPEDTEKIEIEYEVNFWSGKKAIFLVELP